MAGKISGSYNVSSTPNASGSRVNFFKRVVRFLGFTKVQPVDARTRIPKGQGLVNTSLINRKVEAETSKTLNVSEKTPLINPDWTSPKADLP